MNSKFMLAGQKHKVGQGKKVILTLTEKLTGKITMTILTNISIDLHQELLKRKLFGCGTVKRMVKLKGLPKQMSNRKPKKGEAPVCEL